MLFRSLPVLDAGEYGASPVGDVVLVTAEYYVQEIKEALTVAGVPVERIVSLAMALG